MGRLLDVAGLFSFGMWIFRTDIMFGHFVGAPEFILATLSFVTAGTLFQIAAFWFGSKHRSKPRIYSVLADIALLLISWLAVFIAASYLQRAMLEHW